MGALPVAIGMPVALTEPKGRAHHVGRMMHEHVLIPLSTWHGVGRSRPTTAEASGSAY
jgi:hypothetical protein